MKKILVAGILALVVIGCVLAAGCTSTTTTQQSSSADLNQLVGEWYTKYDENGTTYTIIQTIKSDSTGVWEVIDDYRIAEVFTSTFSNFDGKGNFDKKSSNGVTYKMAYSNGTLTESGGDLSDSFVYTKMDSITGIWASEGIDSSTGKQAKFSNNFMPDGTGCVATEFTDETLAVEHVTWKKNADGTYTVKYPDGRETTWTVNKNNATVPAASGKLSVEKKFADNYYYVSMLGPWYNTEGKSLIFFNADGTYSSYQNKEKTGYGTWEIKDVGKFTLHVKKGTTASGEDLSGQDKVWTYDRVNDTFTTPSGRVYVRPDESIDNLTITEITDTTSAVQSTGKCPVVGQWISPNFTEGDETYTAIQTINADGTGYWMRLADSPGIQIAKINKSSFDKYNWSGIFDKESSDGNTYVMVYDVEKKTLTQDGKNVYTKIDPFVGIWSGKTSSGDGGKTTTLIKPDGTGTQTISYEDKGTAYYYTLTWKKNTDGTYAVDYSNGEKRTYTIDSSGKQLTSSSGTVKNKAFLDSTFLMSVTGSWYNKAKDVLFVFNADGTGFWNQKNNVQPFTWKMSDIGKFTVTCLGGTDENGSDLTGKSFTWNYDRTNNIFTDGGGNKFTRPTESIKDRFTLS